MCGWRFPDSTPSMPIFPRIDVNAANTADNTAYTIHDGFPSFLSTSFLSIINIVPMNINTMPIPATGVNPSPRSMNARIIVMMVLLLSIGATLFTSPRDIALK